MNMANLMSESDIYLMNRNIETLFYLQCLGEFVHAVLLRAGFLSVPFNLLGT